MSPEQYTGRPPKQLDLIVIHADGERDLAVLATLGTIRREKFGTLPKMNACIQGNHHATGFLTSTIIEP